MTLDDLQINVKSFKRPHILNRFIYAWFRKSMAERSYGNALRLLGMGIGTPAPIAYLVYKNAKGVNRSYYISIQQPCDYVLLVCCSSVPLISRNFSGLMCGLCMNFIRKGFIL